MGMKIDLHCHSTASDGSLTPQELVQRAHQMQVNLLALTDHDTLAGLPQAQAAVEALRGGVAMMLIPGVELSCRWHSYEIHILGWNFDPEHKALRTLIASQTDARRARAEAIMDKLLQRGVDEQAMAPLRQRNQETAQLITRKHIAEALLDGGYVTTMDDAFRRYLGKGQSAYVTPQWCSIDEAVAAVSAAGGDTAVAHPLAYEMSSKWLKRLLKDFTEAGGHALEVSSGQQSPEQRRHLAELATQFSLQASAGSDFHNPGRWRELGHNIKLPEGIRPVWQHWPQFAQLTHTQ